MQFKGKLMNQTWENGKKPNLGSDFGLFDPNVGPQNLSREFTSTSSYTLFQVIILWNFKKKIMNQIEKMAKNLVSGLILAHLAQIRTNNFFLTNLASSINIHHVSYHPINDPILKKVCDGRTDRETDGQTDWRKYFIGRCLTNVERSGFQREYNL